MRYLYSFFLYLLAPFLWLRLKWKGKRLPAYRRRIKERFALYLVPVEPVDLWIHAVSLGEVIAAAPLIETLLRRSMKVLVTTMTPTGSNELQRRFGSRVKHQYAPYDIPWVVKRFYQKYQPKKVVILETELWPNWIYYAGKQNIPCFLANARLSQKSYQQYRKLRFFFKGLLNTFTGILSQHEEDAARYRSLGAEAAKVEVLGNLKFDLQLYTVNNHQEIFLNVAQPLQQQWGANRPVVIVASTHEPEEELILAEVKKLENAIRNVIVLIAPRHPERFQTVYRLCQRLSFNVGLRSEPETINGHNEIVVLDAIGELLAFYQLSDYVFVGGSLVPVGGHNVLEPISMKVPVFCGPYFFNFKSICKELMEMGALEVIQDGGEFTKKIVALHNNLPRKQYMVETAMQMLDNNKGAVARYVDRIIGE
ncbi:MAG: lipid IV(A) 3-deoxy-D-manno-octulosonic acid transferase [Legionella sp.]|nr:lipid IV(A) 3-deoxy-D-manno-octulosonic acid transferase [Legionella sp.]